MARLARRGKHHVTQEHGREGCWAPCQPITEQDRTPLTNQEPTLLPELISNVTDSNKLGPDELYFFTKWNKSKTTQIFKLIHLHWKYYPSPLFADQFILPRSHLVASDNVECGELERVAGAECHDVTIVTRGLNTFNINISGLSQGSPDIRTTSTGGSFHVFNVSLEEVSFIFIRRNVEIRLKRMKDFQAFDKQKDLLQIIARSQSKFWSYSEI